MFDVGGGDPKPRRIVGPTSPHAHGAIKRRNTVNALGRLSRRKRRTLNPCRRETAAIGDTIEFFSDFQSKESGAENKIIPPKHVRRNARAASTERRRPVRDRQAATAGPTRLTAPSARSDKSVDRPRGAHPSQGAPRSARRRRPFERKASAALRASRRPRPATRRGTPEPAVSLNARLSQNSHKRCYGT